MLDKAHDLRNLFSIISAYCEMSERGSKSPHEAISRIRSTIGRCYQITDDLLREEKMVPGEIDLNLIVSEITSSLLGLEGIRIQLKLALQSDLPLLAPGDSFELFTAVHNLCLNAKSAIEWDKPAGGGILRIATHANENKIWLSVQDNGRGMSPMKVGEILRGEIQATSEHGRGLNIVLDVVKKLAAELLCDSEVGEGTTFTICFPRPHLSAVKDAILAPYTTPLTVGAL